MLKNLLKSCVRGCAWIRGTRPIPREPGRILLIASGWLGDTFWCISAVRMFREAYPGSEIYVCVRPANAFLFRDLVPEACILPVRNLVSDRTREHFSWRALRQEAGCAAVLNCGLIVDLMGNRYSAIFTAVCRARSGCTVGIASADEFGALYDVKVSMDDFTHLSMKPVRIAQAAGCAGSARPRLKLEKLMLIPEKKLCVILPGAGWQAKCYPPEKWRQLVLALHAGGIRVCVCGAPAEMELCRMIAGNEADICCGNLEQAAQLVCSATVVIGGDTGLMHIAAAHDVKCISLFCGTNPLFCGPVGGNVRILRSSCPLRPEKECEFCPARKNSACNRSEFMDIPVRNIMDAL